MEHRLKTAIDLRDLHSVEHERFRQAVRDVTDRMCIEKSPRGAIFTCRLPERSHEALRLAARYHRLSQGQFVEMLIGVAKAVGLVPEVGGE